MRWIQVLGGDDAVFKAGLFLVNGNHIGFRRERLKNPAGDQANYPQKTKKRLTCMYVCMDVC